MSSANHSELNRIYEDLSEDGRLDQPPESPTRLLNLEVAVDETELLDAPPKPTSDESVDQSVDTLDGPAMAEVYDELGEGSVRLPGAGHDTDPPEADDESWLSTDQLIS